MSIRDMDDPREVVKTDGKYDELDKDIQELFEMDKDMDVEFLERDGTGRELWREMDDETKRGFKELDENTQREIVEEIREGRMSLKEARQLIEKKTK